jgi:hypothetical protein
MATVTSIQQNDDATQEGTLLFAETHLRLWHAKQNQCLCKEIHTPMKENKENIHWVG